MVQPDKDFLLLADASPGLVWMSDTEGLCTYVNPAWLAFRGTSRSQELGKGWIAGVHPDDLDSVFEIVGGAMRSGDAFRVRCRILRSDGQYCDVEDHGYPWLQSPGELGGYVGRVDVIPRPDSGGHATKRQLASLTLRERDVLRLIVRGFATKEVAARLGISYKTADSHRTHLQKKLDIHETASLVRFAFRSGLTD